MDAKENKQSYSSMEEALMSQLRLCGRVIRFRGGGREGQSRVLRILSEVGGSMSQQELMSRLDVRAGSLSELLGKLEERGFISRSKNEADRRSINITATELGMAELEIMRSEHEHAVATLFTSLDADEKSTLSALLATLLEHWEQEEQ